MNDPDVVTRAELIPIMIGQLDAIGTHISIYLTLISAYLVASYLVGKKLTNLQVSVATSIYVVAYIFQALILATLFRSGLIAMGAYRENYSMVSTFVFDGISGSIYIGAIVMLAILLSSLWFMWSVRHSEKEVRGKN